MGMSAGAHLYYGIVVPPYDEDYEPNPWYNEEDGDWFDFEEYEALEAGGIDPWKLVPEEVNNGPYGAFEQWKKENPDWEAKQEAWYDLRDKQAGLVKLEWNFYGHYDSGEQKAILSPAHIKSFNGYTWDPAEIDPFDLNISDKRISKAQDYIRGLGWDLDMYAAKWHLVASYG